MPDRSPTRRKAAEYRDRDLAVLRFAFRFGVVVNATLSQTILVGKEAGNVMRRFGDRNWLSLHTAAIPGGITYGTITAQGAKEIGKSLKPKPLGTVALDTYLAVSYYCTLADAGVRRYRLSRAEIRALDLRLATNVPHVVSKEFEAPCVLRVQMAAAGKPATIRQKVVERFEQWTADKRTAAWVLAQDLGVLLLGHTPDRVNQLKQVIGSEKRLAGYHVVVGLGPTSETLASTLRARR